MTGTIQTSLMDIQPGELVDLIQDIPTLPVIHQTLCAKMRDPQVNVPEIADIITQDPALTAKILQLVNAAFYGNTGSVKTISRAVVILGFRAVRSAALAISVFDYFHDEQSSAAIDMAKFWEHSAAVAGICKVLAEKLNIDEREEAYVVGLLHDAGKLLIKRHFPEDFDSACEVAGEQHLSWLDCENALFQVTHSGIAATVFEGWDFPPSVIEAVDCHHHPTRATGHTQLAALVHVADFVSYQLEHGAPGAFPPGICNAEALKLLGCSLPLDTGWLADIELELERSFEIIKLIQN